MKGRDRTGPTEGGPVHAARPAAYFPNLNGLRFLAALAVIVMHVQQQRELHGLSSSYRYVAMQYLGADGVLFFFVLSGFLITYLLLREREEAGSIRVGAFYRRRILRIWPLYYCAVLAGFLLVPHIFTQTGALPTTQLLHRYGAWLPAMFLFFIPNVAFAAFPGVTWVSVLWSVGTEEQFYLLWPWTMRWNSKRAYAIPVIVVAGCVLLRFTSAAIAHLGLFRTDPALVSDLSHLAFYSDNFFRFDAMAIGALGGVALARGHRLPSWLGNRAMEFVALGGAVFVMSVVPRIPVVQAEVLGGLFLVIIVNAAANPRTIVRLEHPGFRYLGKISYGIYVYHYLAIAAVMAVLSKTALLRSEALGSFAMTAAVLLLVTPVAALSYRYLEQPFLRRKKRSSVVVSGDYACAEGISPPSMQISGLPVSTG